MKTHKVKWLIERSEQNVSLSSLYLSANLIEFDEFVRFIEEHFLEKLHVRGRFRFPDRSWSYHGPWDNELSPRERLFENRTDFNLILSNIIKNHNLKVY